MVERWPGAELLPVVERKALDQGQNPWVLILFCVCLFSRSSVCAWRGHVCAWRGLAGMVGRWPGAELLPMVERKGLDQGQNPGFLSCSVSTCFLGQVPDGRHYSLWPSAGSSTWHVAGM